MKILFSNLPWWESPDGHLRQGVRAGSRWPFTRHAAHTPDNFRFGGYLPAPFFLQYAASYTAREIPGVTVTLRDSIARGESYSAFMAHLQHERPNWLVIETATPSWPHDQRVLKLIAHELPETRVIICGPTDAAKHGEILKSHRNVAAIVQGEPDKQIAKVINGASGIVAHDLLTREEMNAAPLPMWDDACAANYWDGCPVGHQPLQLQIWTSRGCPFRCLSGDTPVNTVEGMIPIRDLVGREGLGVFTYDLAEKRAKVSTARNIMQTGSGERLVRVHFDDGTHTDCTPDHRFLAFKWGNQHTGEKEWVCEAKELAPGTHLRALNTYVSGPKRSQYMTAAWTRRGREKIHRMVAEWKIGRRLTAEEEVHHDDRNRLNNLPGNLIVTAGTKDHFSHHPEIAERMQTSNPTKNGVDETWRANMSAAQTGKVRSAESRERYRLAAIAREAKKSPAQKREYAERMVIARGDKLINHCVVRVEELPGLHDTYCMEVPETGWFYANNVLVKNCCFCVWPATMTGNDPDGTKPRSVRCYDSGYVERLIRERLEWAFNRGTPYHSIYLDDDTFNLVEKHTIAMCAVMKRIGLPWSAMCRADTSSRETWQLMKDSGCFGVKIGFESGVQRVIDQIVNKRLDLAKARETAIWLRSIGMSVHGTFTVGLPGETDAEQQATAVFIQDLYQSGGLDTHQLSGTATIEGTPLAAIAAGTHLNKYPGAKAEGFFVTPDGQRKIEGMKRGG